MTLSDTEGDEGADAGRRGIVSGEVGQRTASISTLSGVEPVTCSPRFLVFHAGKEGL